MGAWDPQAIILMGQEWVTALFFLFIGSFHFSDGSPECKWSVADESLLSFNGYMMQNEVMSESLNVIPANMCRKVM